MSSTLHNNPQGPAGDEMLADYAPKDDIALRIAEKQRLDQERDVLLSRRRRTFVIGGLIFLLLAFAVGYWVVRVHRDRARTSGTKPAVSSASPLLTRLPEAVGHPSVSVPPTPAPVQTSTVTVGPSSDLISYISSTAHISLPDEGSFEVERFEFDTNRFLQGETEITNAPIFRQTLSDIRERFRDKYILIFAGASFEGNEDQNRSLCRRRVAEVLRIMQQFVEQRPKGYWAVPAGEKRLATPVGPGQEEAEEERIASSLKNKAEVARQRVLIVLAIRSTTNENRDYRQGLPRALIAALYEHGILPNDYDYSGGMPVALMPDSN